MVPSAHPSHQPKRHLDWSSRFRIGPKGYAVQRIVSGEDRKIAYFLGISSPRRRRSEDRVMAIGKMHKNIGKERPCGSGDAVGQTDTHTQTILRHYFRAAWALCLCVLCSAMQKTE